MAEVIVSALYLWLAFTAVALVVWIVKRMRANRRAAQARRARAVDSLLIGEGATKKVDKTIHKTIHKTIDVSDDAEQRAEADPVERVGRAAAPTPAMASTTTVSEKSAEAAPKQTTKSLGSVIATSVGAPPPRTTPDTITSSEPATSSEAATSSEPAAPESPAEPEAEQIEPTEVVDDRRDAAPPTVAIAELLSGIRLPVDLTPVPPTDPALATTALTFTSDGDPATVGGAFADELERLGYEIFSLSDTDAVARRSAADATDGEATGDGSETLSMSIRLTDPGLAIDVWVGAGESPLSPT